MPLLQICHINRKRLKIRYSVTSALYSVKRDIPTAEIQLTVHFLSMPYLPCFQSNQGYELRPRLRLHGAGRIFGRSHIGSVKQATKKRRLRHCMYTGPVSQVNDMHNAPNLLQAKVTSFSPPLNQSNRSANVTNWPVNGEAVK